MTAPCAIEKARRHQRCFLLFSLMCFERPLEGIQVRLSETHTQPTSAETLTQRIRDQPKSHDTSRLIDDECTNLHFAADRSRKSPESGFDDTQHPIAAQPNSLRETPRGEPRPRFARTEARRATRQDAECARRISGTKALLRRTRAARRFFCAQRRENAGSGKIRTPIVPWVARFCWVLFFFDAWGRVTHRNRRAKDFFGAAIGRRKPRFRFFRGVRDAHKDKIENGGPRPPYYIAKLEDRIRNRACGPAPEGGKPSAMQNFCESRPSAPPA